MWSLDDQGYVLEWTNQENGIYRIAYAYDPSKPSSSYMLGRILAACVQANVDVLQTLLDEVFELTAVFEGENPPIELDKKTCDLCINVLSGNQKLDMVFFCVLYRQN